MAEPLDLAAWKTMLDKNKHIKNTGISEKLRAVKAAKDDFDKSKKAANSESYRKKLDALSVAAVELKNSVMKIDPANLPMKKALENMVLETITRVKAQQTWEASQKPDAAAALQKGVQKDATALATATECEAKIASHLKVMAKLDGAILVPQRGAAPIWKSGVDPAGTISEIIASGEGLQVLVDKLVKKDEKLAPKDPYRANFVTRFGTIIGWTRALKEHAHAPQLIFRMYRDLKEEFSNGDIKNYIDGVKARYK